MKSLKAVEVQNRFINYTAYRKTEWQTP